MPGPGGKHDTMKGWSPMEDSKLLQLIETSGKRWKLIAEALCTVCPENPRTPAMVRNRYLRIERGRWLTEQGMSKNRCGQCGQLKRGHVCQATVREGGSEVGTVRRGSALDMDESVPDSPFASAGHPTTGKLALGAPPLTYVGMDSPIEDSMGDGGLDSLPAHLSGTPGRTPTSLAGMLAGAASLGSGPPGLRPQSSFDMLLKASELRSSEQPKILADTPSVLPGEFPFRSVISEEPSTLSREDLAGSCPTPAQSGSQPALKLAHANRRVEVEG